MDGHSKKTCFNRKIPSVHCMAGLEKMVSRNHDSGTSTSYMQYNQRTYRQNSFKISQYEEEALYKVKILIWCSLHFFTKRYNASNICLLRNTGWDIAIRHIACLSETTNNVFMAKNLKRLRFIIKFIWLNVWII